MNQINEIKESIRANRSRSIDRSHDSPQTSSIWYKIFLYGFYYFVITSAIGGVAEAIFGESEDMPLWAWFLVVPYFFSMLYCSNYFIYKILRNKFIWFLWSGTMAFIVIILVIALVQKLLS